jgi:phosphate transport system substrate-binding protein
MRIQLWLRIASAIAVCQFMALSAYAQDQSAQSLPSYARSSGISGNLSSVGSDTLANLATLWAELFKRYYPSVNIQIQAAGSSTAPPALIAGTANLGPMSRLMKDGEIEAFEKRHGYKPTPVAVAIDALAVYVHKDNPVKGLTLMDLDAIFSANRACGAPASIEIWGDLGLTGTWQDRTIQRYGRNSVSGTYGHFKQHALCNGDFRNSVNEQPGSASVVQAVSSSLNGIGYSGIGYTTSSVRTVPLARTTGKPFIDPTPESALAGAYPLARLLYIYVNRPPGESLEPLAREFLILALSQEGQRMVVKDGYIPLPVDIARRESDKLH